MAGKITFESALIVVIITSVIISGCTSTPKISTPYSESVKLTSETQLSDNMYFIECYKYYTCSDALKIFSKNHTIISMNYYDGDLASVGFFIITNDTK